MIFTTSDAMGEKIQGVYGNQFSGFILCKLFWEIPLDYHLNQLSLKAFDQAQTQ
jgi:hypothetical protein